MPRRTIPFLALCLLAATLAACGTSPHPSRTGGGQAQAGHGIYKVGQPYQIDGTWYYPAEQWDYDETGIASWYGEAFHGKYTANGEVFDLNSLTAAHRTLPMPSVVEVTNLENGRTLDVRVNDRGPYARGRIIDMSRRAAQLLGFEGSGTAKVRVRILVPESIQVASLAGRNGDVPDAVKVAAVATPVAAVAAEALPPAPGVRVAAAPSPAPPSPVLPAPPPRAVVAPLPAVEPPPPLPEKVAVVPIKATQIYIQAGAFARSDNALRLKQRLDGLGSVVVSGAQVNGTNVFRVRLGPLATIDEADQLLSRVVGSGVPEARIVVD
jgi:rare lipoprotein A